MSFVWDDKVFPTFTYWGKEQPDDVLGNDKCLSCSLIFVVLINYMLLLGGQTICNNNLCLHHEPDHDHDKEK